MTGRDDAERADLKPPPLPQVTRLNRNVLLVAAMTVAVVVLAVTHVVRSDARTAVRASGAAAVEPGAVGSFLDDPPQSLEGTPVPPPAYPEVDQAATGGAAPPAAYSAPLPQEYPAYDLPSRLDPDEEAYLRALKAGLRPRDSEGPWTTGLVLERANGFTPGPSTAEDGSALSDSFAPVRELATGLPDLAAGDVTRLIRAGNNGGDASTHIRASLQEPITEFQIMAGTVLPAMMVTALNSEMPGEIVAQISRNVFDSQQRHLLIPRGTRVVGRYDNQIVLGQSRVLIAWTRLIFPDGRSLSMPGLPTKDLRGASGVESEVDNHYGRLYGQAALLSVIGAGAQLSQPQQSSVFTPASVGQVAAGALGQELSRISMETIRRNMDVRPTLEVKPGTPFYIYLERDLVLDGPYVDRRLGEVSYGGTSR